MKHDTKHTREAQKRMSSIRGGNHILRLIRMNLWMKSRM